MRANFRTIEFLAATTALIAPSLALSQEAATPVPPAADAEYSGNWGLPMINALPAYLKGYTGKGVTVAIVDTGLDVNHPEFAGRISHALRNFGTDKKPDDVSHAYDRHGNPIGHGTHVAGIIGAARDGQGMQGVAYEATILPLRAIGVPGHGSPSNEAIRYAVEAGAKVLNGSYSPPTLRNGSNPNYTRLDYLPIYSSVNSLQYTYDSLKYAAAKDVVLVFSAGNNYIDQPVASARPGNNSMFPLITPENTKKQLYRFVTNTHESGFNYDNEATYEFLDPSDPSVANLDYSDLKGSLIAVVAVDKDGKIASHSDRCGEAAEWCMAAPGGEYPAPDDPSVAIYSTWPDRGYKYLNGTSMAAPHVTGAAAVVRSAFPYMNARQTIETILTTATDLGSPEIYGQGLLNLGDAIDGPMEFRYADVFDVDTKGYTSIWSNPISGPGDLTKRGEGTLVLTGNSTFTGPTTVLGGTLAVDGSIVSEIGVSGQGVLAGYGAVGTTIAGQGGAIAPGSVLDPDNAMGVLTINGNFQQGAGSIYQAGIAPGEASDLIDVSGSATIDGGSAVELMRQGAGQVSIDTRYTLLTAAGGVNGVYGSLTGTLVTDSPFVDFELAYDPRNVFLDVDRTPTTFADVAHTSNQRSAATAKQALGPGHVIHDSILFLTEAESRTAFNLLSGEIHASVHSALIQNSHFVRDAANDRIRAAFEGIGAAPVPVMAYGPDGAASAPATTEKYAVWGQGFGAWGHLDGDGNAARLDHSTGGFIAGGDALVGGEWRLGLLAGYSHTSFDVDDRAASGSSNNYHLGLYAGTQRGPLGFRSGLSYTWHRIETDRVVAFPGFSDGHAADYDAGTFQAFGELGYRLDTAAVSFEPYANLAYVNFDADDFSEDGGAAALSSGDRSSDATFTTLGLRASSQFMLGSMTATVRGGIGWQHAFGDVTPETSLAIAGGSSFAVRGVPIAEDAALIEAGLDVNLTETATLGLDYQGQLASDAQEHGFNAKLAVRF
jgi:subtilase-type serine protease